MKAAASRTEKFAVSVRDIDLAREHVIVELAGEADDNRIAERHEQQAAAARESARNRRLRIGQQLAKVRPTWPARGPAAPDKLPPGAPASWAEFLASIKLDDTTACRYMDEARDPDGLAQKKRTEPNPATPSKEDALALLDKLSAEDRAEIRRALKPARDAGDDKDRDSWCTPPEITSALPPVDLDPCSNERSTVRAAVQYWLSRGEDGLKVRWRGSLWINGPFSDLEPWAVKLVEEWPQITACGWLCNTDSTTEWWRLCVSVLPLRLDLNDRTAFVPPPGVKASSNDRPQTLLMDDAFWRGCNQPALLKLGTLWRRSGALGLVR